ncbi:MAG: hypothetical protein ACYC5O_13095 [Anaerolineae bacterium]
MPDPSAVEQFNRDLETLRHDAASLRSKIALGNVRADMDNIERQSGGFPGRIADLRARGYVLADQLDVAARELGQRWWQARPLVQQRLITDTYSLEADMRSIEAQVAQLAYFGSDPVRGGPALAQAQIAAKGLEAKIDTIERGLRSGYEPVSSDLQRFDSLLDQVDWMLKQVAEASFPLAKGESAIRAVKAVWVKGEKEAKDDPRGVLFLTTQRLVFEQKQDVATKKVLFITTEKQRVQRVQLEVPLDRVSNAEGKKMGLMGHEDHFGVMLDPGSPVSVARFHIDGQDCYLWQSQVMQARRGEWASLALA